MRQFSMPRRHPTFGLTLLCAAALAACGGGGSDSGSTATTADEATAYAANATLMAGDASTALDAGVLAAQSVVTAHAAALSESDRATALAASGGEMARPAAVTSVQVPCGGGGTATLSITGGTAQSVLNGQFDTGEVYQLVYANCRGVFGAVSLNGTLTLTVQNATATDLSLGLVVNNLVATLPRGSVTLAGSTTRELSISTVAGGATQLTGRFASPSLTLTTQYNTRTSVFALTAVDITRQGTWLNGILQSSSINGSYTLAATLPNGSFNYTVATQGGVNYSASGVPTSGSWTITLPKTLIGVTVANATATITIDDGKDGTIDRTIIVPVARLQSDAG